MCSFVLNLATALIVQTCFQSAFACGSGWWPETVETGLPMPDGHAEWCWHCRATLNKNIAFLSAPLLPLGIKQFGVTLYNGIYSATLLMHLGGNWVSILNAIPAYVRNCITFKPYAAPPDVNVSMNLVWKVIGACYIDGVSFTKHVKGKYWLKLFHGIWWHKDCMIIYNMPNNMASFEEVLIVFLF